MAASVTVVLASGIGDVDGLLLCLGCCRGFSLGLTLSLCLGGCFRLGLRLCRSLFLSREVLGRLGILCNADGYDGILSGLDTRFGRGRAVDDGVVGDLASVNGEGVAASSRDSSLS